jgi:Ran GTPase-activating protein (RanGAP) involved in mRNA processing and transport
MAKSIRQYCEYLRNDFETPVEIILDGKSTKGGNVSRTTKADDIRELASLIKCRSSSNVDLTMNLLTPHTEVFNTLLEDLAGSTSLNSLTVGAESFGVFVQVYGLQELSLLVPVLSSNGAMTKFVVTNTRIPVEGMRLLRPFISSCISLTHLKLSLVGWTDDITREVTEALLLRERDLDVLEISGGLQPSGLEFISQVEVKRK